MICSSGARLFLPIVQAGCNELQWGASWSGSRHHWPSHKEAMVVCFGKPGVMLMGLEDEVSLGPQKHGTRLWMAVPCACHHVL